MMENSFEKQISNKLKNTQVQPSEHLLDSIFEKRAAKAKRFVIYPYAAGLLGVAIISAIGYWFWEVQSNKQTEQTQVVRQDEIVTQLPEIKSSGSENKSENLEPKMEAVETTKPSGFSAQKSKNLATKASSSIKAKQTLQAELPMEKAKAVKGSAVLDNQYFNLALGNRPMIQKTEHQGNSHLYVYQTVADDAMVNRDFLFSRVVRLQKILVKKNIESIDMTKVSSTLRNNPSKSKKPIFIDLMFNPGFNFTNMSGDKLMVDAGKGLRKASIGQGFGIRVSVPISSKWNVFSGINYREQSNLYQGNLYYNTNETQINTHVKYINDPLKGVIKIETYDTVNKQVNNTQYLDFKNRYKVFQVPVGFSYNFGYKRFEFAINGSALVNYIKSSQGRNINLDQHNTSGYESANGTVGFGAGLSVMGALKLNNRIRLIAEPGMQYFGLKSVHFGNKLNEKVMGTHLTIGLRYTLF